MHPPDRRRSTAASTRVAAKTPSSLVLPLAALQVLWHHSRTSATSQPTYRSGENREGSLIAHGSLVMQSTGLQTQALVGPMRTSPLSGSWTPPDPMQGPREGLCLVVIAPSSSREAAPSLPTAEDWLQHHAPDWRLVSRALRPALALFWMSADGRGFLGWRTPFGDWSIIARLDLPGSGLRRVSTDQSPLPWRVPSALLPSPGVTVDGLSPVRNSTDRSDPDQDPNLDRYSRQRLALGAPVLHTLQHRCTVVIGLGRTGSPLVHSAVQLGMPVLGLDPDVIERHNLDGDFSPLHEGWTKAAALRKLGIPEQRDRSFRSIVTDDSGRT